MLSLFGERQQKKKKKLQMLIRALQNWHKIRVLLFPPETIGNNVVDDNGGYFQDITIIEK